MKDLERIAKAKSEGWRDIAYRHFPGTMPSTTDGPIILLFGFQPGTNIWAEIPHYTKTERTDGTSTLNCDPFR